MASKLLLVGFDEAGRGPLAGPVAAASVILPQDFPIEILNDSKKLSEKKREAAEIIIKEKACWGIGLVDHKKIDEINILQASMLAMQIAFDEMQKNLPEWLKKNNINDYVLSAITDGNKCPAIDIECRAEAKADGKYPPVMAASILAKVCRDRIMLEMDKKYPAYGYAGHKGYPTKAHREICHKLGPSPIQRMSFHY
ncbi:MAG: ribonuclease HII [Treponema sp.]|nr:ribonuclease HII [Treponema sp.]